jgi:hypothetical protein
LYFSSSVLRAAVIFLLSPRPLTPPPDNSRSSPSRVEEEEEEEEEEDDDDDDEGGGKAAWSGRAKNKNETKKKLTPLEPRAVSLWRPGQAREGRREGGRGIFMSFHEAEPTKELAQTHTSRTGNARLDIARATFPIASRVSQAWSARALLLLPLCLGP